MDVPTLRLDMINNIYINKVRILNDLIVHPNTYIFPAGIYGQCLYHFLNNKDNIVGFIDNNPKRNGQRQYGTNKIVYHPDSLTLTDKHHILVCNCFYINELIDCIKIRWPTVKYTVI
jgi:hypothetical protein